MFQLVQKVYIPESASYNIQRQQEKGERDQRDITIKGVSGVNIYQGSPGHAGNVAMGTDISALTDYVSTPLLIYNTMKHLMQFF